MPVYCIRAGDTEFVKIGWAVDPEQRLRELQCAHYEALRIIRIIEGDRKTEAWLHSHFRKRWIRNEWFRFDEAMLSIVPDLSIVHEKEPVVDQRGEEAFKELISWRGVVTKLAEELGISTAAVSQWRRIPQDRLPDVERITGVPRDRLRPDLFEGSSA